MLSIQKWREKFRFSDFEEGSLQIYQPSIKARHRQAE